MSKLYNSEGDPVCDCTVGAECGHHENEHRPVSYVHDKTRYLTCSRGDLDASVAAFPVDDADEHLDAKFAEHLAEVGGNR